MKPPRIPSLFKMGDRSRPKSFGYQPRTFDERKERLKKRKDEIDTEMAKQKGLGSTYENHLRERISDSWARRETRRQSRNSGYRVLLILAGLIILLYLIFSNIGIPNL